MVSKKQIAVITYMLSNPTASDTKICNDCGIDVTTMWRWKHNDEFNATWEKMANDYWHDYVKQAQARMVELSHAQNLRVALSATQYILDSAGFNATQKIDANVDNKIINITVDD